MKLFSLRIELTHKLSLRLFELLLQCANEPCSGLYSHLRALTSS